MTYANITQSNIPANISHHNFPQISKEELLKMNICVAHARCKNQEKPGSYAYELSRVLKANKLPTIVIPEEEVSTVESGAVGGDSYSVKYSTKPKTIQSSSRHSSVGDLEEIPDSSEKKNQF